MPGEDSDLNAASSNAEASAEGAAAAPGIFRHQKHRKFNKNILQLTLKMVSNFFFAQSNGHDSKTMLFSYP